MWKQRFAYAFEISFSVQETTSSGYLYAQLGLLDVLSGRRLLEILLLDNLLIIILLLL